MNVLLSLLMVILLLIVAWVGVDVANLHFVFGIVIPYLAIATFIIGFIYRVVKWATSPVPFNITTTCGQQKCLSWIKPNRFDNPTTKLGMIGRMALEILFFRSLFRNTKTDLRKGPRLIYSGSLWLWLGALAFHWSFFLIFLRHYRFFAEPVPSFVILLQDLDGFMQIGVPVLYMTDLAILIALTYLFLRRLIVPQLRYISLPADYFPLLVLLTIAVTGVLMRYFFKMDVVGAKELALGLMSFNAHIPEGIASIFYVHLFFVCVLLAYFPFSKLMHLGGVFMSPTRNMPSNSREKRHVNPWNYDVKVHTYEAYEDEFRDVMRDAGLPLDKEK